MEKQYVSLGTNIVLTLTLEICKLRLRAAVALSFKELVHWSFASKFLPIPDLVLLWAWALHKGVLLLFRMFLTLLVQISKEHSLYYLICTLILSSLKKIHVHSRIHLCVIKTHHVHILPLNFCSLLTLQLFWVWRHLNSFGSPSFLTSHPWWLNPC